MRATFRAKDPVHTVGAQHPMLHGIKTIGTGQGRLHRRPDAHAFLFGHNRIKRLRTRRHGARRITEQSKRLVGPFDSAAAVIEIPTAQMRSRLRLAQQGFAAGQTLHGLLDRREVLLDADVVRDLAARIDQRGKIQRIPEQRSILAIIANRDLAGVAGRKRGTDRRALALIAIVGLKETTIQTQHLIGTIAGQRLKALIDVADTVVTVREASREDDPGAGLRQRAEQNIMPAPSAQGVECQRDEVRGRLEDLRHVRFGLARGTRSDRQHGRTPALPGDHG